MTGYEHLIDSIELPDQDDRHVLAAAIRCGASVIVTFNLGDFPSQALAEFSIEAQHPDDFVLAVLEAFPGARCGGCAKIIAPVSRTLQRHQTNTLPSSTRKVWKRQ